MKFIIQRTSAYGEKPCEEAKLETITEVDVRVKDSPSKIPMWRNLQPEEAERRWKSEGTNHRLVNNRIARDMGFISVWTIEINTLEELMAFRAKYGDIIVKQSDENPEYTTIEIYDDYRE